MGSTQWNAMKSNMQNNCNGFTLIEVLVALTIVAISLGAIITTSGTQASQAGYLKQKSIAHWVAMNEITQLQLDTSLPSLGSAEGSINMANHEWHWERNAEKTEDDNSRKVTLTVFIDKNRKNNITSLSAFIIK